MSEKQRHESLDEQMRNHEITREVNEILKESKQELKALQAENTKLKEALRKIDGDRLHDRRAAATAYHRIRDIASTALSGKG